MTMLSLQAKDGNHIKDSFMRDDFTRITTDNVPLTNDLHSVFESSLSIDATPEARKLVEVT